MKEGLVMEENIIINLEFIIVGLVDGSMKINGEYPTQVVYYDNLFRTNKKEKLLKLIQN